MKEYNVSAIITKESGESGGAETKINAALELNIPVILVLRPEIKELENHSVVRSIDELKEII
jgi:precorrin-6A/cobalt-precorrin-6A reductase